MKLKLMPTQEIKTVKKWDHTERQILLNGCLVEKITDYHRKDAYSNLYDFGIRKDIEINKHNEIQIIKHKEIRISWETAFKVWSSLYLFGIVFPFFMMIYGDTTIKDFWWIMTPIIVSIVLYIFTATQMDGIVIRKEKKYNEM